MSTSDEDAPQEDMLLDEDENQLTQSELIEKLEEAWFNEKFAPEILPHKADLVEMVLMQINNMEENIEHLSTTDFTKTLYQIELDRLKFLVTSYLRTRLCKIEKYATYILKQESLRENNGQELCLDEKEHRFAKAFEKSIKDHIAKSLHNLPVEFSKDLVPVAPNMNSFVFLKSKRQIDGVVIEDGTPNDRGKDLTDLNAGSQIIIAYSSIAHLVKNGDVYLI